MAGCHVPYTFPEGTLPNRTQRNPHMQIRRLPLLTLLLSSPMPGGLVAQTDTDPDTGADVELDAGTGLNATFGKVWQGLSGGRRLETMA